MKIKSAHSELKIVFVISDKMSWIRKFISKFAKERFTPGAASAEIIFFSVQNSCNGFKNLNHVLF